MDTTHAFRKSYYITSYYAALSGLYRAAEWLTKMSSVVVEQFSACVLSRCALAEPSIAVHQHITYEAQNVLLTRCIVKAVDEYTRDEGIAPQCRVTVRLSHCGRMNISAALGARLGVRLGQPAPSAPNVTLPASLGARVSRLAPAALSRFGMVSKLLSPQSYS